MPDRLSDLLQESTVGVHSIYGAVVGFFVGPRTVLTELPPSWTATDDLDLEVHTYDHDILLPGRVSPAALHPIGGEGQGTLFGYGTLTTISFPTGRSYLSVELDDRIPVEQEPLLIAGHGSLLTGSYFGSFGPFDMRSLRLSSQLDDEMAGAPILNRHTGRVWGMVVLGLDNPGTGVQVMPFAYVREPVARFFVPRNRRGYDHSTPGWRSRWELAANAPADEPNLLFRLYIPSQRLYATEASRLLSLFREWLSAIRGFGIRQAGYRTNSGEMIEFFATTDEHVAVPDLQAQLETFSRFLSLCTDDGEAAAAMLTAAGVERATSIDIVNRFGREARRLELDMRHDRQTRVLSLQQRLEGELLEQGIVQASLPYELGAMIERLVPGPAATTPLALLAAPQAEPPAPINVQVYQNFIQASESTVINSVAGNLNSTRQVQELLALIERFGGQDAPALQSAVFEAEDAEAPPDKRTAAKARLRQFLTQLSSVAKDVSTDLLSKYLESKGL